MELFGDMQEKIYNLLKTDNAEGLEEEFSNGLPEDAYFVFIPELEHLSFAFSPYPLMNIAAFLHSFNCMRMMFAHDMSIVSKSGGGFQPVHMAASQGYIDILEFLNENGAELSALSENGSTPLFVAVQWNQVEAVIWLLQKGVDPNSNHLNPLLVAINNNFVEIISELEKGNANPLERDQDGNTVLHIAIQKKNYELVQYFSPFYRVLINESNSLGVTPFLLACQTGIVEMVQDFLLNGADINKKDFSQQNALHYGVKSNEFEMISFLTNEFVFLVSQKDKNNRYPAHIASEIGNLNILQHLLSIDHSMICINYTTSLLHLAVKGQNMEVIQFLFGLPDINFECENEKNILIKKNKQLFILQQDLVMQIFFNFYLL